MGAERRLAIRNKSVIYDSGYQSNRSEVLPKDETPCFCFLTEDFFPCFKFFHLFGQLSTFIDLFELNFITVLTYDWAHSKKSEYFFCAGPLISLDLFEPPSPDSRAGIRFQTFAI